MSKRSSKNTLLLTEEINQIINQLPDNHLIELLDHLRQINQASSSDRAQLFQKIIQEDRQLLQKLA